MGKIATSVLPRVVIGSCVPIGIIVIELVETEGGEVVVGLMLPVVLPAAALVIEPGAVVMVDAEALPARTLVSLGLGV